MARYNDFRENHRPFFGSLVFTKEGELDLSWCFVFLMGLGGLIVFIWVSIISPAPVPVQIAAWTYIGGAFASVLIAAIPINKAKILAKSTVPGEVSKSIASAGMANVETSTDLMELKTKYGNLDSTNEPG
jgi:hypothetical protein